MRILVTGGAGYIGSHAAAALMAAGHDVTVLDNFANSRRDVLPRLETIAGRAAALVEGDVRDEDAVRRALAGCDAVMHFAALKSVPESVEKPALYRDVNVEGTRVILREMAVAGVRQFVFSSSATVYGVPQFLPITEDHPLSAVNPYGETKIAVEKILDRLAAAGEGWRIAILRYFNPVGAHDSGLIGEEPSGTPGNLVPYVADVALGRRPAVKIYGDDYDTPDGTGVRDYIHIDDLAAGHVMALDYLARAGGLTVNLGTGRGYSVREVIAAYEAASGRKIPVEIAPRRAGDVAVCYADPARAARLMGWQARKDLADMCRSSWKWVSRRPF